MTVMFEVLYKSPSDPHREAAITERVGRYGGRLTYREEPQIAAEGPVCLTFEFDAFSQAEQAASQLRLQGEHVEGPMEYSN
jgi:hypothetical protein